MIHYHGLRAACCRFPLPACWRGAAAGCEPHSGSRRHAVQVTNLHTLYPRHPQRVIEKSIHMKIAFAWFSALLVGLAFSQEPDDRVVLVPLGKAPKEVPLFFSAA